MSMAPALKSKPFIAASGSMAEDSSGSPTAEAPLKCITSPTITIGRNAHSRKTISFFVFISLSKFRFIGVKIDTFLRISKVWCGMLAGEKQGYLSKGLVRALSYLSLYQ